MNQKSNKLTVPDLISVGVFTALYFVLVTVATFACALLPGVGNILLPAVAALISGSVYMLLAAKLQKFGGITIMLLSLARLAVRLIAPRPPASEGPAWTRAPRPRCRAMRATPAGNVEITRWCAMAPA